MKADSGRRPTRHGDIHWAELASGVRLSYRMDGPESPTPILLLHAWAESRGAFDRALPVIASSRRVFAVDLRGHGNSDKPSNGYSLLALAGDVLEFMDAVGLSSAVLVGSSSGGYLAQQVAVIASDRVAGLVLVGSPRSLRERPPFADEVEQLVDPIDVAWIRRSLTWFPRFRSVPEWYIEDRVRDGRQIPARVWRETFKELCSATPPTEMTTITCPALILWGDRDELLTRGQQNALAEAIPDSRLVVYRGTGHLVLWEQPDRVASDLIAFVSSLPSS